ncbi:jg25628 [Pararge aegeria aegeria]|uniref:Jg25628 protein n=1 Tax=Pararge aegeria aegeria TaxID=348720 RepID=A0A8S4QXC6_9NEOP|nr:jg25628 [Pararge aegeria aegeria]
MSRSNCNGNARDSFELYESEKIKGSPETEKILRGFPKLPLVVCERLDITPLLKMPLVLREPTFVAVDQVANFSKKCSVRLKRENLLELKEVFLKRNLIKNASYECNICQKVYLSEKKLLNHQENKHVILCYKPKNKIRKKVSFSDQIIVHEVKEYHRCRKCPKIYEDYNSLRVHMKEFHKKRRCYICFYCSKDFIDRMFFKVHIKLHCDSCGLLLPNKKQYIEHRRSTCKTVKKYECKTCHISLFNFLDLKDHSYEHLGQFYICDICKDRFDDKCGLTHHIKFLHSKKRPESLYSNHFVGSDRVYVCNFCELSTDERVTMAKHVSTFPEYGKCAMTGYKDFYFCDQCFEKFSTETDMLQHKWTHYLKTTNIKNELPKPVTLLNMKGSTTNSTQNIQTVNAQNVTVALLDHNAHTPRIIYNANEKLPAFLQPRVLVEKLIVPLETSSPVNFSDVTNLDLNSLKKPIIDRKKTILSKHRCERLHDNTSKYLCMNEKGTPGPCPAGTPQIKLLILVICNYWLHVITNAPAHQLTMVGRMVGLCSITLFYNIGICPAGLAVVGDKNFIPPIIPCQGI